MSDTATAQNTDAGDAGQPAAEPTATVLTGDEGGAPDAGKPTEGKPNEGKPNDEGEGEGKPGEEGSSGKEGEGDGGTADEPTPFDPEKLTLPEGVTLDPQMMEAFTPLAKDLPQESAQAFIDLHVQGLQSVAQAVADDFATKAQDTRDGWLKAVREDGELAKPENQKLAASFLTRFGASDDLRQALNETGMGNHPELVRLFLKAARSISEDNPLDTGGAADAPKSLAERLYPNHK